MAVGKSGGFSLIETMIVTAVLIAVLGAASIGVSRLTQSSRKLDSNLDLSSARKQILELMSCSETVANIPPACLSGSSSAYVDILSSSGDSLVPADGAQVGPFTIRARCEPGTNGGIEIRAAKLTGKGGKSALNFDSPRNSAWFLRDEMSQSKSGLLYDWNHPKGVLFGKIRKPSGAVTADSRLCKPFFSGTVQGVVKCDGQDEVMVGYDTLTQTPQCRPISELIASTTLLGSTGGSPSTTTFNGGGGGGSSGGSSSQAGFFVATAQVCGSSSDDCSQCESRGLKRCGASVGAQCSRDGYRCYQLKGCRVFKCVVP